MAKDTVFSDKSTLQIGGNVVSLAYPLVMGILNVTPDSFYDGGKYVFEKEAMKKVRQMVREGVDIIDVGGYSSRPGAENISETEEIKRIIPVIENIRKEFSKVFISIDTFRSGVAESAVKAGAQIINDITGGEQDKSMFDLVTELNIPYILMHMKGTPQTMRNESVYEDLLLDILVFFEKKLSKLRQNDVKDIVIDPGFGFAKTIDQNYVILKNLQYFKALGVPLLAGVSRKSMIYKKLRIDASRALNGTTVLNTIALINGAQILRVHDVKEAVETIKLFKLTYND